MLMSLQWVHLLLDVVLFASCDKVAPFPFAVALSPHSVVWCCNSCIFLNTLPLVMCPQDLSLVHPFDTCGLSFDDKHSPHSPSICFCLPNLVISKSSAGLCPILHSHLHAGHQAANSNKRFTCPSHLADSFTACVTRSENSNTIFSRIFQQDHIKNKNIRPLNCFLHPSFIIS